ncbi:MAG: hypothetical protein ABIA67_00920 [Candidatus Margulisiibacteriota bacterium]
MIAKASFGAKMLKTHSPRIATAAQVRRSRVAVPRALSKAIRSPELETWFAREAASRLAKLPSGITGQERQIALEMDNRYPNGSMQPISLAELLQMSDLCVSAQDILDRAREGVELLTANPLSNQLGTAARGIPGGGASSRAAKWARLNPETAAKFGFTETTPRPLYRVGEKSLFQHTLDMSQHIARELGRVFPNLAMTNSENVAQFMREVRSRWGNYRSAEFPAAHGRQLSGNWDDGS